MHARTTAAASHFALPDACPACPGLVNLHTHAAMTLLRGYGDDRPLMDWLRDHIWPVEARLSPAAFVRDGTLLACAEMLRGGITCFNDMYFFPEAAAEAAVERRHARGHRDDRDRIAFALRGRRARLSRQRALRCAMRCATSRCSRSASRRMRRIRFPTRRSSVSRPTRQSSMCRCTRTLHETPDEIREQPRPRTVFARSSGCRNWGLLGPGLIAVHAIHLEPYEIALLAQHGCSVAHCPSVESASSPAASRRSPQCSRAASTSALGTDGAASNNRLDLLDEMRTAALLAKGASGDAAAAARARCAAHGDAAGAKALGLEASHRLARAGQARRHRRDRICPISTLAPCYDPLSHHRLRGGPRACHPCLGRRRLARRGRSARIDASSAGQSGAWRDRIKA